MIHLHSTLSGGRSNTDNGTHQDDSERQQGVRAAGVHHVAIESVARRPPVAGASNAHCKPPPRLARAAPGRARRRPAVPGGGSASRDGRRCKWVWRLGCVEAGKVPGRRWAGGEDARRAARRGAGFTAAGS